MSNVSNVNNVENALHDLNEARKYMDDRRTHNVHAHTSSHAHAFGDIQSEKIEGRKPDMGAKLARQFSAVFRKTKLIIQASGTNTAT